MGKGRGNPNAGLNGIETRFTTDREEPLTSLIQVKAPASLAAELKAIPGWQEFLRKTIRKAISERNRRSAIATKKR